VAAADIAVASEQVMVDVQHDVGGVVGEVGQVGLGERRAEKGHECVGAPSGERLVGGKRRIDLGRTCRLSRRVGAGRTRLGCVAPNGVRDSLAIGRGGLGI
jgi:hypothetical protein